MENLKDVFFSGNKIMNELIIKNYHGCKVIAKKIDYGYDHPYPWSFQIIDQNGNKREYFGIPNKCETAASALRRGWYRAKWLADGTYNERYT